MPIRLTTREQPQAKTSNPSLVDETNLLLTCPIQIAHFMCISQERVSCLQYYFILCSSSFPVEKASRAGEKGKHLVQQSREFPMHSTFCICTSLQAIQTQIHVIPWISTESGMQQSARALLLCKSVCMPLYN